MCPRLKASDKKKTARKMPKNVNEKTDEIGSFSLVSRLTRDPTIKILMFTTTAR